MEVYVVTQVVFLCDPEIAERDTFHQTLDDLVELYFDLDEIISSYGFDLPVKLMTEQEVISELYHNHNMVVIKKEIYTKEIFEDSLEITQML